MSEKRQKFINVACAIGIALNTAMFGMNLFLGIHDLALFNLLCAGGCWVGYFKTQEEKNGD